VKKHKAETKQIKKSAKKVTNIKGYWRPSSKRVHEVHQIMSKADAKIIELTKNLKATPNGSKRDSI
jgi:hypothetical protein